MCLCVLQRVVALWRTVFWLSCRPTGRRAVCLDLTGNLSSCHVSLCILTIKAWRRRPKCSSSRWAKNKHEKQSKAQIGEALNQERQLLAIFCWCLCRPAGDTLWTMAWRWIQPQTPARRASFSSISPFPWIQLWCTPQHQVSQTASALGYRDKPGPQISGWDLLVILVIVFPYWMWKITLGAKLVNISANLYLSCSHLLFVKSYLEGRQTNWLHDDVSHLYLTNRL